MKLLETDVCVSMLCACVSLRRPPDPLGFSKVRLPAILKLAASTSFV
jgi:hypothetical protein